MPQDSNPPLKDRWKYRRRFMTMYFIFISATTLYLFAAGQDTGLANSFISIGLPSLGALIGGYVLGGVMDKKI